MGKGKSWVVLKEARLSISYTGERTHHTKRVILSKKVQVPGGVGRGGSPVFNEVLCGVMKALP